MVKINQIVKNFDIEGDFMAYQTFGNGHINDTYALTFKTDSGLKRYILQRLNDTVFPNIELLMNNISMVTQFIRDKVIELGGNPDRECLNMIMTRDGETYYNSIKDGKWRCMLLIENTEAYQNAVDPYVFEMTGKAFGEFIQLLDEFPIDEIKEVIPNFHNTVVRYAKFRSAVKENEVKRRRYCRPEIQFAKEHEWLASKIVDLLNSGAIPMRVTHNDTKINNLLMDTITGEAVCVIDLDTIMPGSLIYDFGDGIRSGCNTAMEDEKNLNLVSFNMEMFEHFAKGFIRGIGDVITKTEKENLAIGAVIITFECGLRFLTDYLMGDKYFKTQYNCHNLVRCRTQFKLVSDMLERFDTMNEIIMKA